MTTGSYRLSPEAARDFRAILRRTLIQFGTHQYDRYAAMLHQAASMVAAAPDRPGSTDHGYLQPGLRAFPVALAAGRRTASPHFLFYRPIPNGVLILRILHAAMDPTQHLPP